MVDAWCRVTRGFLQPLAPPPPSPARGTEAHPPACVARRPAMTRHIPADNVYLDEDRLPQPYRMLDKLVTQVVDRAWEIIDQKKAAVAPISKLTADATPLKPNTSLHLQPPTPEAIAVLDMDTYAGRADGCIERRSAIFDDTSLVSKALHERPVVALTGYHITSPVVASSDGQEVKVVCFPIAPIVRRASMTLTSSRKGSLKSARLAEEQPQDPHAQSGTSERKEDDAERMLEILHLSAGDFAEQGFQAGGYAVERMVFSPGGRYLAVAVSVRRIEKVLVYDLGDTNFEKYDTLPEVSKTPLAVLTDYIPDAPGASTGSPKAQQPSRPGTAASANKKGGAAATEPPAVPVNPDAEKPPLEVRAEVYFLPTKDFEECAEAHAVAVVWVGGHTATLRCLRTLPHVAGTLAEYNELRESTLAELKGGGPPADATGGDPKKKGGAPAKGAPPPSAGGTRRPAPLPPPPVATGDRVFHFPSTIHTATLSHSLELLAVGCAEGVVRVINLFNSTAYFSTVVEPRRVLRKQSPRTLNCLSLAVWGHKYIASSWAYGDAAAGGEVCIHDMQHAHEPAVGDWVEVNETGQKWAPALVRGRDAGDAKKRGAWTVVVDDGREVRVPMPPAPRALADTKHARAEVMQSADPQLRRVALVGRLRGMPLISKLYYPAQAPLLFWVAADTGVCVYDMQARRVRATLELPGEVVVGAGVAKGMPMQDPAGDDEALALAVLGGVVMAATAAAASDGSGGSANEQALIAGGVDLPQRARLPASPLCHKRAFLSQRSVIPHADGLGFYTASYKRHPVHAPTLIVNFHTLSLPAVVRTLYPVLGEEFSSLTGADSIYHVLCTAYHEDLHSAEYVNAYLRVLTGPTTDRRPSNASLRSGRNSILSARGVPTGTSRRGSNALSMAGKSGHTPTLGRQTTKKLAFGATTEQGSVVTEAKARQLLGANAQCLAYKEEKKKEKGLRRQKVTAMLKDLQTMYA